MITSNITLIMDQISISKSSPYQKDSPKAQGPTIVVPANRRAPPLDGGNSTKIGGMWNLKHEISSPKFYELIIKTELKGDTDLDLKNLYNCTKVCLNMVTRFREDLLHAYQSIKRHSEFEEYFIPDRDNHYYYWNVQIYTSLVHSLLMAMTNDICLMSSMSPQAYKVVSTYSH